MWWTALILGFAGSVHCLGMCSPLVMAVSGVSRTAVLNRFIYNAGRILTYGVLGAIVASVGLIIPLHKYQNILSIALGIALLVIGLGGIRHLHIPIVTTPLQQVSARIKSSFRNYLTQKTRGAMFAMGALNGLLPCGLTLLALTWCITLRGPVDGLNFMLLFGAGTLPVMLGFTSIVPVLSKTLRWDQAKLTTTMLIASGCLLIARVFIVHIPHQEAGGLVDVICR